MSSSERSAVGLRRREARGLRGTTFRDLRNGHVDLARWAFVRLGLTRLADPSAEGDLASPVSLLYLSPSLSFSDYRNQFALRLLHL